MLNSRQNISRIFAIFFATILICLNFVNSQIGRTCYSPDQYSGKCVELEKCEHISRLRYGAQQTQRIRLYVSLSQCGILNRQPLVCCTQSTYPENPPAPDFTTKLPLTTRSFDFVTQSTFKPAATRNSECFNGFDNRIFGGSETSIDEMPFTALLGYSRTNSGRNAGGKLFYSCGGALISHNTVLTAAHCTHEQVLSSKYARLAAVRLGEWDQQQNPDCETLFDGRQLCAPPVVDVEIARNIVHENYVPFEKNQGNDIAILKLQNSVNFNDFVRPICLPKTNEIFENVTLVVGGFGKTEVRDSSRLKLKTEVDSVSNFDCAKIYANQQVITTMQICAIGEGGKDSCNGDSGQPLIYPNPKTNRMELVGLVSYGPSPCGQFNKPGVYTRIGSYLRWIKQNMN